jgi:hypothetical protein
MKWFGLSRFYWPRNSFACFEASNHCKHKQHAVLQALGNGSMNESWLSQTGGAQKIETSRTAGGELQREKLFAGTDFPLGHGLGLDAVQQFGKDRLDVLADITGHDDEQQVVPGLKPS